MTCICETVEPLSLLNYCLTYWSVTYYSNHVLGIRDLWLTHFQCLSSHANQCTMHCLAYIVLIYTWPYVVIWVVLKTAHWLVNSTKCLKIFSEVHWPLPGKDSTGGEFGARRGQLHLKWHSSGGQAPVYTQFLEKPPFHRSQISTIWKLVTWS